MRSLLVILISLVVLVAGFGVYWLGRDDKTPTNVRPPTTNTPIAQPKPGDGGVGDGKYLELLRYDKNTGRLTSRISIQQFERQPDGRRKVQYPEADFYMSDGQVVRIKGRSGMITMQEELNRRSVEMNTMSESPSRGALKDVVVLLFPTLAAAHANDPSMTLTMDNAAFDNEAYKISTEAFTTGNRRIAADMVPVRMRGKEYNFDGKGLEIRWNQRDQRLELLKVSHGERLEILNADALLKPQSPATLPAACDSPLPAMLAATDRLAAADALRGERNPQSSNDLFRATFEQNVRIEQDPDVWITADRMIVDFRRRIDEPAATRPATTQAFWHAGGNSSPVFIVEPNPSEACGSGPGRSCFANEPVPADASSRPAATQPAGRKVVVTWTGPLTIVPVPGEAIARLQPGQAVAHLTGKPVTLQQSQADATLRATCASLVYRTSDRSVLMEEGPGVPLEVIDSGGTVVRTPRLEYSELESLARLSGGGSARLPTADGARGGEFLDATWAEQATLSFREKDLKRAELRGDVVIQHPQVTLKSQSLALDFEKAAQAATVPATQPAEHARKLTLRQLDATDKVRCDMIEPDGARRSIDARHLKLETSDTPDGRFAPKQITADGNVVAIDPQQTLKAGYLRITMAPATQPATQPAQGRLAPAQVRGILAQDNVTVTTKEGQTAKADTLIFEMADGRKSAKFMGQPAAIRQDQNELAGPIVILVSSGDSQEVHVPGAGSLKLIRQEPGGAAPEPVDVTWKQGMNASSQDNRIDCSGEVLVQRKQIDGTLDQAKGDRLIMTLEDVPKPEQKEAQQQPVAPATAPATHPATAPAAKPELQILSKKTVRLIDIQDKAQVSSVLKDAAGNLVYAQQLDASRIQYDAIDRHLTVPGPGTMRIEDHRSAASLRGETAFTWQKQLDYNEKASNVLLDGQVQIGHIPEGAKPEDILTIRGDTFTAQLQPAQPANANAGQQARLKTLHGEGNIEVRKPKLWFQADTFDYDAATHILVARGTERRPVRMLEDKPGATYGLETATCPKLELNVQTNEVRMPDGVTGTVRH